MPISLGGLRRCFDRRVGHENAEFFTAVPAHKVRAADRVMQHGHDLFQDRVTLGVPVQIVDLLEEINVQQNTAAGYLQVAGIVPDSLELLEERPPIERGREWVARGQHVQLLVLAADLIARRFQASQHSCQDDGTFFQRRHIVKAGHRTAALAARPTTAPCSLERYAFRVRRRTVAARSPFESCHRVTT